MSTTHKLAGNFDVTSCRSTIDAMRAHPLYAIALTFRSENSVLRCRLVISASLGCFQLPGLSVMAGSDACLMGVDCGLAVIVDRADEDIVTVVARGVPFGVMDISSSRLTGCLRDQLR
jgi:hypothetical protein